jgi:hypothetical protein
MQATCLYRTKSKIMTRGGPLVSISRSCPQSKERLRKAGQAPALTHTNTPLRPFASGPADLCLLQSQHTAAYLHTPMHDACKIEGTVIWCVSAGRGFPGVSVCIFLLLSVVVYPRRTAAAEDQDRSQVVAAAACATIFRPKPEFLMSPPSLFSSAPLAWGPNGLKGGVVLSRPFFWVAFLEFGLFLS